MKSMIAIIRTWGCKIGCIFVVIFFSNILLTQTVEANSSDVSVRPEVITIIVGESTIVKSPWPAVRVAVTDPKVADVKVLTPEQVLLQGIKVGSTDLILWSEDEKEVWQWKVRVRLDTEHFKKKLDELFPLSSLEVSQSGEVLIVKGLLRKVDQAVQLHSFLDKAGVAYVDMTSVAGVQQVQLQVRVAEVSRTAFRALGINAFHTDDDFFGGMRLGSATGTPLVPSIGMGPPEGTVVGDKTTFEFHSDVTPTSLITMFAGVPRADFEVFLRAIVENQYLRILANPTLVALSGEEASFLAGGEFPIPVPQSGAGAGGFTTITVEYKPYGVHLLFRPVVLGDGTIRLYVSPEVSELTTVNAIQIEGFSIPSLLTRKAETTLELKSGQTFAMAGLIKNKIDAVNSRIPGLGDLPVLGPLFRSTRYQKDETELVVLVTASLVEPMSLGATPPLPGFLHTEPNDWEFYLEGRLEGEEPAKIDPDDAEWLKQMGLERLMGPGAWDSYGEVTPHSQAGTALNPGTETGDVQGSQGNVTMTDTSPADVAESAQPLEE
ncbi:MAG: type II and III secretion system protein family protein [Planctomycetota bacterium]